MRPFALIALLATGLASAGPAHADPNTLSLSIGPGPGCDHAGLQEAVDAVKADHQSALTVVLRLSGDASHYFGQTYEIDLTDLANVETMTTLRLVGGHDSCASSEPQSDTRTVLDANGAGRVFDIRYEVPQFSVDRALQLENLAIVNGAAPGAGGGIRIEGNADRQRVVLSNVRVADNQTGGLGSGGGISIEATAPGSGSSSWLAIGDSVIENNAANGDGGGIACFNLTGESNGRITIGDTRITGNEADFRGGGVAVIGCDQVGFFTNGASHAVAHNQAGAGSDPGAGGGISVRDGGVVRVEGTFTDLRAVQTRSQEAPGSIHVHDNLADYGGGIAIEGEDSRVDLVNARVVDNTANEHGGGLYVVDGASLEMGRIGSADGLPGTCRPMQSEVARCSVVAGNHADADGGGIVVDGAAKAKIFQTFIHDNSSLGGRGSVAFVSGQSTLLELEGAVVHSNKGSIDLFHVRDAGILEFHWTSLAGNRVADEDLRVFRVVKSGDGTPILSLSSSIIWEPGAELASQSGDPFTRDGCVIGHLPYEDSGLDEHDSNTFYSFIDPRLRDPDNGDLRLRLDSPAVDYCDLTADPEFNDMFDNPRGVDVGGPLTEPPNPPNGDHDFDIGAHELPTVQQDIFSDRFES